MPLQVIFSVYQKPVGVIERFTAGNDKFVGCATQVTLEATIYGDISGHSFKWRQINYQPLEEVTWLTSVDPAIITEREPEVYLSTATYEYLGDLSTDKFFQFTIDEGTPFQQQDEVIAYATPTSQVYNGHPTTENLSIGSFGLDPSEQLPVLNLLRVYNNEQKDFDAAGRTSVEDYALVCQVNSMQNLKYVEFQRKTSLDQPWETIATVSPDNAFVVYSLSLNTTFRAVATYQYYDNPFTFQRYSNTVYTAPIAANADQNNIVGVSNLFTGSTATTEENSLITSYTISMLYSKVYERFDNIQSFKGTVTTEQLSNITSYTTTMLYLKTFELPADNVYSFSSVTAPATSLISSYSVLDLTGGGIGGG